VFTKVLGLLAAVTALIGTACAPVMTLRSEPAVRQSRNACYTARLQPVAEGETFYNAFQLEIVNATSDELEVDWNQTRYLHNGHANGPLIFSGVTARTVRAIPPDTIPAGGSLEKTVWPLNLVAYAPYGSPAVRPGQRGFQMGALPQGENGIDLVVRCGKAAVRQRLSVLLAPVAP
jgi:hypothetical protein